jgi:hypothetical protein
MDIIIDKKTRHCTLKSKDQTDFKNIFIQYPKISNMSVHSFKKYKSIYATEIDNILNYILRYMNNMVIEDCSICIAHNGLKETVSSAIYKTSTNTHKKYL